MYTRKIIVKFEKYWIRVKKSLVKIVNIGKIWGVYTNKKRQEYEWRESKIIVGHFWRVVEQKINIIRRISESKKSTIVVL